ncbi:hypothetical protein [Methanocella sp. MCL-LM]|uniref:hypothetical protein n=1 Tax=Methanocella sp. MCL-LM TaxID=3412035 RepID=UPI003C796B30
MPSIRTITKILAVLLLLTFALVTPALTAASVKPVLSVTDYKVVPYATYTAQAASSPLMPGDSGTVVVTVTNTLKASTAVNTTVHSDTVTSNYFDSTHQTPGTVQTMTDQQTTSEGTAGSATVEFVNLIAAGPVQVTTGQYMDTCVLGAGDSARFEFGIKADSAAPDGTYELTLKVKTSDDDVYLNYPVRVQVDRTEPRLIVSKYAEAYNGTENEMSLDIANPLKTPIEAVSVKAAGDQFVFEPQEFYVGTLKAGDMYTADFKVDSRTDTYDTLPQFYLVYKTGDNWHQTTPIAAQAHAPRKAYWDAWWEAWWPYVAVLAACVILAIALAAAAKKIRQRKP